MSGPKRSRYRLERLRRQKLQEERTIRQCQINQTILDKYKLQINQCELIHEKNRVLEWIKLAESDNMNKKLYRTENQIKGIGNYIGIIQEKLDRKNQEKLDRKKAFDNQLNSLAAFTEKLKILGIPLSKKLSIWILQAKSSLEINDFIITKNIIDGANRLLEKNKSKYITRLNDYEKKEQIIDHLKSTKSYKDIMTNQILYKADKYIELVKKNISTNIKYSDLKKIESFIDQVGEIYEDHLQTKDERKYMKDTISSFINPSKKSSSQNTINGKVDGTSIQVTFEEDDDSAVIFNVDESSGNCLDVIDQINNNLMDNDINLGEISIDNTLQSIENQNFDDFDINIDKELE